MEIILIVAAVALNLFYGFNTTMNGNFFQRVESLIENTTLSVRQAVMLGVCVNTSAIMGQRHNPALHLGALYSVANLKAKLHILLFPNLFLKYRERYIFMKYNNFELFIIDLMNIAFTILFIPAEIALTIMGRSTFAIAQRKKLQRSPNLVKIQVTE